MAKKLINVRKVVNGMKLEKGTKRMLIDSLENFKEGKVGSKFDPNEFSEILKKKKRGKV